MTDQSRRDCIFIETYVNGDYSTPAGVVHSCKMRISKHMRPRWGRSCDQRNAARPIPEGLHIYRNGCKQWSCDPGRGRTFWQNAHFYKDATSLRSVMRPIRPIPEVLHVYRNVCRRWSCDPGRGRTFSWNDLFYKHATSLRSFIRPMQSWQTNPGGIAYL